MLINYYGPAGTFPTYSFVDVLHNRFPETAFRDTIVLIGAAATGLGDTFVTPFSLVLPGIERHATVIANALRGDALQRRDTTALLDLGASEATWEHIKDRLATRELDIIRVKGKDQPTRIFEVLSMLPLAPPQVKLVQRFTEGLQAYRVRRWGKALTLFQAALQEVPNDYPSQLYIQRCQEFQVTPPRDDWDGVYMMQTK